VSRDGILASLCDAVCPGRAHGRTDRADRSSTGPSSRAPVSLRHLVFVVLLAMAVTMAPSATPAVGASGGDAERHVLRLINRFRVNHGREPIRMVPGVRQVAGRRSSSMARLGYFAHVSPSGVDAGDLLRSVGAPHRRWGEIIGYTSGSGLLPGGRSVVRWWTRSPRHRRIILGASYGRVGVGVAKDGRRALWTVVFVG
jgi:uncharacterized protein YkwD